MNKLNKIQTWVLRTGALVLLAGVALAGSRTPRSAAIYALGALLFCPMLMMSRYEGGNIVILRLRRQQLFACLCLLVSAGLYVGEIMDWTPYAWHKNYWLVALCVGCVFLVYTVFRLSHELKNEK